MRARRTVKGATAGTKEATSVASGLKLPYSEEDAARSGDQLESAEIAG
jgi:hypothetical protein